MNNDNTNNINNNNKTTAMKTNGAFSKCEERKQIGLFVKKSYRLTTA